MSFDDEDFDCIPEEGVEYDFITDPTAFADTVHTDTHYDSGSPLFSQDALTFKQLSSPKDLEAKFNTPSLMSPIPSTDESYPSSNESPSYVDTFACPSQADTKQIKTIRTIIEGYIVESQPYDSQTSCSNQPMDNYLRLERDPAEINRTRMTVDLAPHEMIEHHEALSFQSSEAMMNSTFLSSPESMPVYEEPWEMPEPQDYSLGIAREIYEAKTANNRQSKYKNAYSLAVEQVQRLMKDRLDLKKGDIKKYEAEEKKSEEVKIYENRLLEPIVKAYESIDQESNNVKEKIKHITEASKTRADERIEMTNLIRERDLLLAAKKEYQKNLTTGLQYKRLDLVSCLDKLINDGANAFMKKDEFKKCLKEYPKIRTLSSMRSYFEENVKFGLIVSRISVDFLGSGSSIKESMRMNKASIALKFWLIKSPMEHKSKKLFLEEVSRAHIRNEVMKIYQEMEEKARKSVSEKDLKQFYSVLNNEKEEMNVESVVEVREEGKRMGEFAPSSKEKIVKRTRKN